MNDHELGSALRRQVLADLERGRPCDGRRLQALVGDFCGDSQIALLPALRYLVMTPACGNALSQQPPLPADGSLLLRLQQELSAVFTATICGRMEAVLRGLLALPAASTAPESPPEAPAQPSAMAAVSPTLEPAPAQSPTPSAPPSSGHGLVAALGFIAGVLAVGLAGLLTWMLVNRQALPLRPQTSGGLDPSQGQPVAEPRPITSTPPPAPDLNQVALESAIASVQQLYSALSSGNNEAARQLFSTSAADQFDPAFFSQFQRVSVGELHEIGRSGPLLTLQGVVSFVYPDGSSQSEARSFVVDTASQPALVTASSFLQVVKARQ